MSHLKETVYNGRDNTIELELTEDDVAIDHTAVTRLVLELRGDIKFADSADDASNFDFTNTDRVILTLGTLATSLPVGKHYVKVIAYDAVNTNGIEWEPEIIIEVDE